LFYFSFSIGGSTSPKRHLFLFFVVDMIHWPVILVLDHPVAIGKPEEVFALLVSVGFYVLWVILSELSLIFSGLLICEWGEYFRLLNFSVLEELVESRLPDWDDLLDNVPKNSLGEW